MSAQATVTGRPVNPSRNSAFTNPAGNAGAAAAIVEGVRLLGALLNAIAEEGVIENAHAEVNAIIDRADANNQSVSVVVLYIQREWRAPDPTGNRATVLIGYEIVGAGASVDNIIQEYLSTNESRLRTLYPTDARDTRDAYVYILTYYEYRSTF
ncbi:MAG: hypothetical protein AAGF11_44675 [Myxococcota bacterium]